MIKKYSISERFQSSAENSKKALSINTVEEFEKFAEYLKNKGLQPYMNGCFVDFEEYSDVPLYLARRIPLVGPPQKYRIRGSMSPATSNPMTKNEEVEITLKNFHSGDNRDGSSFTEGIEGLIQIGSDDFKKFDDIETLVKDYFKGKNL